MDEKFSNVLNDLGRILFEEMERLAPSSPEVFVDWDEMGDWDRLVYVNSVRRLLVDEDRLRLALQLAGDDGVDGCASS